MDRVARPIALGSDERAYAISIVGESMWPRFRPGRRVAVSLGALVTAGDDVVVELREGAGDIVRVLIQELVRSGSAGLELRQFKPDLTFNVPAEDVLAIEKVLGELI